MESTRKKAAFGSWPSSISAEVVAGRTVRFGDLQAEGETLYWTESRPTEGGRMTLLRGRQNNISRDLTPAPYSARSRVHEYGGGEFIVVNAAVYFVNSEDQNVYVAAGNHVTALTNLSHYRFADFTYDRLRRRLICVAERHGGRVGADPRNMLVAITLDGRERGHVTQLVDGADFYACPRVSPDGTRIAWVEWDLPDMPWDESQLMVAEIRKTGELGSVVKVAGGSGTSVFQPQWTPDGTRLLFVDDRSGWGNLHIWNGEEVRPLALMMAEFGLPLWSLGMRTYAVMGNDRVFATFFEGGQCQAGIVDIATGEMKRLSLPYREISQPVFSLSTIYAFATTDESPRSLVRIPVSDQVSAPTLLRPGMIEAVPEREISKGRVIKVQRDGKMPVYALYYPPTNGDYDGRALESPPLIVTAHGGPTGMADRGFKAKIQYWTSRGFAFLDVDYGGSWGYGRAYRAALDGKWGILDVEDVIAATNQLVRMGLADSRRIAVSGSSAGGFTVLNALIASNIFHAGVSYYGVSDLAGLMRDTHKFESGYLFSLTGSDPDSMDEVSRQRSPLERAENIRVPMMFFQGLDDKVVPPEQSRQMVETLKRRGIPVGYMEFAGEGHGFRNPANVIAALQAEHAFYVRVLRISTSEQLPAVTLFNEDKLP